MFTSIKGTPGVTTLACLVGATWPSCRPVAVVESDPFGGDLAARFGLSARHGWCTFSAASRRAGPTSRSVPISRSFPAGWRYWSTPAPPPLSAAPMSGPSVTNLVECSASPVGRPPRSLVDAGRLVFERTRTAEWIDRSDRVVVVVRNDTPSVVKIAERSVALRARCGERTGLVVVGAGAYDDDAIEGHRDARHRPGTLRADHGCGGRRGVRGQSPTVPLATGCLSPKTGPDARQGGWSGGWGGRWSAPTLMPRQPTGQSSCRSRRRYRTPSRPRRSENR